MDLQHVCRVNVQQILLGLWFFEVTVFVYFVSIYETKVFVSYAMKEDEIRTGGSLDLWRNIELDPPDLYDTSRRSSSMYRHGKPLNLYYEANSAVSTMNYTFPSKKHSGLSVNCADVFRLGKFTKYVEMNRNQIAVFKDIREKVIEAELEDCDGLKTNMGYVLDALTEAERVFPIAYSMMVYKDFAQVEMLLRAIYRPQNVYCIHVDLKSDEDFHRKLASLAGCFPNVFIVKRSVNVTWGLFSVLEPELICLEELWALSVKWKYWINLTGQEYPLRTNYELVKILTAMNGTNNIAGRRDPVVYTRIQNAGYPPHSLDPVRGDVHVVVSRAFADYILHNQTAKDVLQWSRDVKHPDEIFFNTLQYNPSLQVPGSVKGMTETRSSRHIAPYFARFKNWFNEWYCHGKQVRGICVFAMGDLPLLASREELFVNKFHMDHSPEALYCMEELIYNRTVEEYLGVLEFNVSYYKRR